MDESFAYVALALARRVNTSVDLVVLKKLLPRLTGSVPVDYRTAAAIEDQAEL